MPDLLSDFALMCDPVAFARSARFEPDPWQQLFLRCQARQIVVCAGRQTGKTETVATKVLHRACYWPRSVILMTARAGRQSGEGFRRVRERLRELEQPFEEVEESFPNIPELREDKKTSLVLENASRVVSLPCNPAGVRSFSAVDLVVLDEAAFAPNELLVALVPMLAVSDGQLILLSTPNGRRGFFWECYSSLGADWTKFSVRSDQCARITPAALARYRSTLGDLRYRQEFLCEFVAEQSGVFDADDVQAMIFEGISPLDLGPRVGNLRPGTLEEEPSPVVADDEPRDPLGRPIEDDDYDDLVVPGIKPLHLGTWR